jgi:hypothetical protein
VSNAWEASILTTILLAPCKQKIEDRIEVDEDLPMTDEGIKRNNCKIVKVLIRTEFEETSNPAREGYGSINKTALISTSQEFKEDSGLEQVVEFSEARPTLHEKTSDLRRSDDLATQIGVNIRVNRNIDFEEFTDDTL